MNILILGSGGREHALAWKILQSDNCDALFVAPGNAGTAAIATNILINPTDFDAVADLVRREFIDMIVVGPEDPLVHGIYDFFKSQTEFEDLVLIGPSKQAARLEGSKEFAKEFLMRHDIPTARYASFTAETIADGFAFLETLSPPYVLKADGLAAGKGVVILQDLSQARQELEGMLLHSKFGAASERVVIEEFLDGIELSCFVLTDGKSYKILPTAKDYKRIGEADTGLNTGGMGAVSPVPFADQVLMEKIESRIVKPTVDGLQKDGLVYRGFIFIGLIVCNGEPMVIEYNVRMGDPETEVVLPRIQTDILELFRAVGHQTLSEKEIQIDERAAATVVVCSGGYPEHYEKGKPISGLENVDGSIVFHAGTLGQDGQILSNGGRVLAVTSLSDDYASAIKKSYQNIAKLHFDTMYFRKDIGFDLA